MSYAYAVTNALANLAAGSFTFSAGLNDATRLRLIDARMSSRYVNGGAVASGLTLVIDFGAAVLLTGFALLNHNAAVQKADAAVKVESADDAAITVNNVVRKAATTLNNTAPQNKDHVLQFAIGTARRYWRLTFTWTGTVTNFAIGELFAFNLQTQLSRKAIYGEAEAREFKTTQVDFYNGGSRGYLLGGPVRELRLPFSDLSPSQLAELYVLQTATNGGTLPFVWIPSYEATAVAAANAEQECVYGKIGTPKFEFSIPDFQLYQPNDVIIRSLGREIGS